MDLRAQLETDCRTLADALRAREVPRAQRKQARALLQRAFVAIESEDTDEQTLFELGRELDRLCSPPPLTPLTLRSPIQSPVTIRLGRPSEFSELKSALYLSLGERLEEMVDWFWERCKPDEERRGPLTARERALEEFGSEDMEYVWGRRRRRRQGS